MTKYHFDSLSEFLQDNRGSTNFLELPEDGYLCSLLRCLYDTLDKMTTPWITLVLGAEVLDRLPARPSLHDFKGTPDDPNGGLAGQLYAQLGLSPEEAMHTANFTWNLLLDRSSFRDDTAPDVTDQESVRAPYEPLVLRLIHACATLNTAYFFTKSALLLPVSTNEDQAVGMRDRSLQFTPIERAYWQRASDAMADLVENLKKAIKNPAKYWKDFHNSTSEPIPHSDISKVFDETQWPEVQSLCKNIQSLLEDALDTEARPAISSRECRIITQIAWFYLVESLRPSKEHTSYPDWDELLVAVGTAHSDRPGHEANDNASLFEYDEAVDAIQRLLNPVTKLRNQRLWEYEEAVRKRAKKQKDREDIAPGDDKALLDALNSIKTLDEIIAQRSESDKAFDTYADLLCAQSDVAAYAREINDTLMRGTSSGHSAAEQVNTVESVSPDAAAAEALAKIDDFLSRKEDPQSEQDSSLPTYLQAPPPVLYVTTLDIQTELSLWYHNPPRPFLVVVPVNLVIETPIVQGRAAWLGYVVDPRLARGTANDDQDSALRAIQQPTPDSTFLLNEDDWHKILPSDLIPTDCLPDDPPADLDKSIVLDACYSKGYEDGACMPIVVKLCGSPLVELPQLPEVPGKCLTDAETKIAYDTWTKHFTRAWDLASTVLGFGEYITQMRKTPDKPPDDAYKNPVPKFSHRIILDEHQAIETSLREVSDIVDTSAKATATTESDNPSAEAPKQPLQRLPKDFAVGNDDYWRYWMVLGVPAFNVALRYRTISQLIRSWFETATAVPDKNASILAPTGGRRILKRLGVAVNRQPLGKSVSDLLEIDECDTVAADCRDLTAHFADYVIHLRTAVEARPYYRPKDGKESPVDTSTWQPTGCSTPQIKRGQK